MCYNSSCVEEKTKQQSFSTYADMAELADAHGSGPCEGNFMKVQILLSAPGIGVFYKRLRFSFCFLKYYISLLTSENSCDILLMQLISLLTN